MLQFQDSIAAALGVTSPEPLYRDGWVVMSLDTEYNDEYNYFTEGYHISSPVFLEEEEANRACVEKNAEWRESADPDDWDEDLADITMYEVQKIVVQV